MTRFHLPILCLAFCFDHSLTAAPSASGTAAGGLTQALPASRPAITFTNKSGLLISDAEVVRTNDGVSLVWEKNGGASGGVVRLEDLPEDLQARFGYDPAKTAAADELDKQRRAQWQQSVVAAQAGWLAQQKQMALNQEPTLDDSADSYPVYASPRYAPTHRHYIRHVRTYRTKQATVSKPPATKTGVGQKGKTATTQPKSSNPHP